MNQHDFRLQFHQILPKTSPKIQSQMVSNMICNDTLVQIQKAEKQQNLSSLYFQHWIVQDQIQKDFASILDRSEAQSEAVLDKRDRK